MRTVREKAATFVDDMRIAVPDCYRAELEGMLVMLLKEQNRDTRRVCAEAVSSLAGRMDGPPFGCSKMIAADEAHLACLNVEAL